MFGSIVLAIYYTLLCYSKGIEPDIFQKPKA